jgi:hypothetical protein
MENRSNSCLYSRTAPNCSTPQGNLLRSDDAGIAARKFSNRFLLIPDSTDPASCPPAFQYPNNCKNP